MRVCLCVCLSAPSSFFSGVVAIRYILPVLWITSCFFYNGPYMGIILSTTDRFRRGWGCTPRAKSGIYNCLVLICSVSECKTSGKFWCLTSLMRFFKTFSAPSSQTTREGSPSQDSESFSTVYVSFRCSIWFVDFTFV